MLIATATEQFMRLQDDAKAERRRRKAIERADEDRILDPWERYRALNDHCDSLLDLTELYDRKTRFALLILGGLNALNLLLVVRADVLMPLPQGNPLLVVYGSCYALLSLALLLHAISALKPRSVPAPTSEGLVPGAQDARLQLMDGAAHQTLDEYCERWQDAQIGQINRELAVTAFMRAHANVVKIRALHRVYLGLYVLVGVTATLCVGLAVLR